MLPKDPDATWLKRGKRSYFGYKGFAVVASFLAQHSEERLENGRQRVVRQGHLPERKVVTGIGAIPVKVPRSRDRKFPISLKFELTSF